MHKTMNLSFGKKIALGAAGCLLAASCTLIAPPAYAETAAEAQAAANAAFAQLTQLQAIQEEKSAQYFEYLTAYQTACENRNEAQKRIDEIQTQITEIQGNLGNRARTMYRDGLLSFLDVLFGASSFDEFSQTLAMLDRINQNDADNIQTCKDLRAEAVVQHSNFEKAAQEAEAAANEAAKAYEEAAAATAEMEATFNSLSAYAMELCAAQANAAYAASADALGAAAAEYGAIYNADGTITDTTTGQTYSSVGAYASATGNSIVDRARAMIGSSYVWGGVGGSWGGYDCSGLVSYALTGQNNRLGNTTTFMGWNQVSNPQPGDVVVNAGHTGIISGVNPDGSINVIHAMDEDHGVVESTWSQDYWSSRGYIFVSGN